ncbi:MAG: hypothetical protein CMI09_00995 [Oceanospirillaceae bacterium]|nr:hypothetical protein [Oceanospirillaceae bacterium]
MRVHKIESLESRLARYQQKRLRFFLMEVPSILTLGVLVVSGMMYAMNFWFGGYENWLIVGAVLGACLSMPLLLESMPKRPTIEDVHADQSIRRAFGMDDTVDD